ncbi:MAG: HNH endonuclease [Bdellovibrio sp.]|nr:HNH endonuclease [Bdellovibrio sp.]
MNLKHLSNFELLQNTKELVTKERKLLTTILWHIKEVSDRKLYLQRAYPNLFAYCVKELGYTPGSASRRIKAMRLLKDLPIETQKQVEQSLTNGTVSLVNISSLQNFFEQEKKYLDKSYTHEEKLKILDKIENKTQDECQRLLFAISTNPEKTLLPKEKEKIISDTKTELKIIADEKLMDNLQRLKELMAHKNPNPTYAELLEAATEFMLDKIDPERKPRKNNTVEKNKGERTDTKNNTEVESHSNQRTEPKNHSSVEYKTAFNTRYVPAEVKRQVYLRDKGMCTFKDLITNRVCGSRYGLEYDHAIPVALNGSNTANNLRLRCRLHNLLEAEEILGKEKMKIYAKK